jgi:citrate lyase subunit beta/citryl-CoA lyase
LSNGIRFHERGFIGTGSTREVCAMTAENRRDAPPELPIFVPATRPDRFERAARSGADSIIIDLEDALGPEERAPARAALARILPNLQAGVPVLVRVNAATTADFTDDLELLGAGGIDGVMLPKAEARVDLGALRERLPRDTAIVALIETPQGLADARTLAHQADRLAFGSIDYAHAVGIDHTADALLTARSEIVLAAALADAAKPFDGVTPGIDSDVPVERDAGRAAALGFGGKLLIHPAQIIPAIRGFQPRREDAEEARELIGRAEGGVSRFRGRMIDRPVLEAARRRVAAFDHAEQRLAAIRAGSGGAGLERV